MMWRSTYSGRASTGHGNNTLLSIFGTPSYLLVAPHDSIHNKYVISIFSLGLYIQAYVFFGYVPRLSELLPNGPLGVHTALRKGLIFNHYKYRKKKLS